MVVSHNEILQSNANQWATAMWKHEDWFQKQHRTKEADNKTMPCDYFSPKFQKQAKLIYSVSYY